MFGMLSPNIVVDSAIDDDDDCDAIKTAIRYGGDLPKYDVDGGNYGAHAPSTRPPMATLTITGDDPLALPIETKRKFSFPIILQSTSLLSDVNAASARRRLSNVSDVVTRKLSNTIGWKIQSPAPTPELVAQILLQGKCLCGQYIRFRLKRAGLFTKKLGLQRLRSIIGTPSAHIVREVYPVLSYIGDELERMHPSLYSNVTRQITRPSSGDLPTIDAAPAILSAVARDLFRTEITWSKIVALFAITGGLAIDCVRQDHPEYLTRLVDGMADVIEDELAVWINENGGWSGLSAHTDPEHRQFSYVDLVALLLGCVFGMIMLYFAVRFLGYQIIWCLAWIR